MCIFLIFSLKAIIFPSPHQTPSPSTPYRHIPLHTYSPAPRVSWNATPLNFLLRKIIHFQLFPVSLLTNHLPVYIIYEHTFYFFSDRCRVPAPKGGVCLLRIGLHPAKIQRVSWNATPFATRRDFQLPVIRATKDKDFTVMSIHHLRDTRLSLKAIGLFSIILSLPPEWKFSVAGLSAITKDGITSWPMRHPPIFLYMTIEYRKQILSQPERPRWYPQVSA